VIHLREVALLPPRAGQLDDEEYPFAVPVVASLRAAPLDFDAPMTFLVGENGSGKSAILEGLACAAGSIAIAGDDPRRDPTLAAARALGDRLRLTWRARTQRGFFLRAEDFFGFAKYISALRAGLERDLIALNAEPGPETYGRKLARGTYSRSWQTFAKLIAPSTRHHTARAFSSCSSGDSRRVGSTCSTSRKHRSHRSASWHCCRCYAR